MCRFLVHHSRDTTKELEQPGISCYNVESQTQEVKGANPTDKFFTKMWTGHHSIYFTDMVWNTADFYILICKNIHEYVLYVIVDRDKC